MSSLGVISPWALAALVLLLPWPLIGHACPQSCSCSSPKEVHCTFRHLSSSPPSLPRDTERINLGFNSIQAVGVSEFAGLSRLEMLMLHGNSIDSVSPGAFQDLHSLQILKLSYNKLKKLSSGIFKGLSSLVRLHLDHNAIEFIEPFCFSGLTTLKLLQLEGNQLRDVHPNTFITLSFLGTFWGSSLRHLYLSDNKLENLLPGTLQHLSKLEVLYLHGNPWTCDCQQRWLLEWNKRSPGVIKCKKERDSDLCAQCFSPQRLNSTQVFQVSSEELSCDKPVLHSPLKLQKSSSWEDPEPEPLTVQDFEHPLGQLTFMLSDNQENMAHVACAVKHPNEGTSMGWESSGMPGQIAVNVTLITLLECDIEKDELQKLWRLIAYYYESPAVLERGLQLGNTSRTSFQYSQVANDDSPYFTELKGHLLAEPIWLLQPRITLQLNRRKTTTKKLVLNFTTFISKQIRIWDDLRTSTPTWIMIQRGAPGRVQTVLEGSEVTLTCKVITSGEATYEWMLPDLSKANSSHSRLVLSDEGKMVINPVAVSDSGLYHCLVQTENEVDLVPFRLIVRELLLSPDSLNGKEVTIHSGGSFTLPCSISSVPPSRISWYLPKNKILLQSNPRERVYMSHNGSLLITEATQEDAGEYSCLAANLYGADMLSHLILIESGTNTVPPSVSETVKESTGGISYKRYQATEEDEEEGSGDVKIEIRQSNHNEVPDRTGLQHGGNKARKVWEKRRNNMSVKELDPKRWALILAKAHGKTSIDTTTDTPEREGSTQGLKMSTSFISVRTENTAENEFELLQPTPTLQPTQVPKLLTTSVYHRESNVLKKVVATPVTPMAIPSTKQVIEPVDLENGVNVAEKTKVTAAIGTQGRTPLYRRRRPSQRRNRPHFSSHNSSLPTSTRAINSQGNTGHIRTNPKATQSTASTNSYKPESSDKNDSHSTHPDPPRGSTQKHSSKNHYNVATTVYPLTVSKKSLYVKIKTTSPSMKIEYKRTPSSTVKSGSDNGVTLVSTKSLDTTVYLEKTSSSSIFVNYRLQTTQLLPEIKQGEKTLPKNNNSIWYSDKDVSETHRTAKEPHSIRHLDVTTGRSVNQSSSSESTHSFITNNWSATIPPKFDIPKTISTTEAYHLPYKTHSIPHLSYNPASPSFPFTAEPHLAKPVLSKLDTDIPVTQSPLVQLQVPASKYVPGKEINLYTSSSNSRSPAGPFENVAHIGQVLNQPGSPHKDPSSKLGRRTEGSMQSKSDSSFKQNGHRIPQQHNQNQQHQPSTTTLPWSHHNHVPVRHTAHSPRHYPFFHSRAWPFPYPGARDLAVTNRPEITALTAKSTVLLLVTTSPVRNRNLSSALKPLLDNSASRGRDLLLLSRLRNKYRQPHLDFSHLSQYGKSVTSPPKVIPPTVKPRQAPTSSKHYSPVTPANPALPLSTNKPYSTASVLFGSHWHYNHWTPRKLSTALPFPNLMGSGVKPRIVSVNVVSLSALAETHVFLPCESSGNPKPSVSWTKVSTGATIQANTKHGQRFEVLQNGTFVIKNVQLQDRGQYLCTAQNTFGSDRMVITLAVMTQPPRILPPKSKEVSVYLGRPVILDCLAEGKPQAQTSWILPDRTFIRSVGLVDERTTLFINGTLRIQTANFSSKGDYKCIASNAAGADTVTYHLHVVALPPTINEEASENVALSTGRSIYIHCTTKGEPYPSLKWTLPGGKQMKPSQFLGGRIFVFHNGTLYVKNISPSDSGKYECTATNTVGTSRRVVQIVIKQEAPNPRQNPSQKHRVSAMYGSTVYLHCSESTNTQNRALWTLPSKAVVDYNYSPDRQITAFPNGTLRIQLLSEQDSGDYLCMFQRLNGQEIEQFQLEVLMKPPKIKPTGTAQKKVTYGENFQVDCVASGLPDPEVSWSLPDGTMINNALQSDDSGARSRRYVIFGNGTLLLQQMGMRDEGDYTCYAENKLGKDEMRVNVKVVPDSPKISSKEQTSLWVQLGKPAHLNCEATGDPSPTIIWLSPSNEVITSSTSRYLVMGDGTLVIRKVGMADPGTYACVARNSAGDDIKNVKLEVEGKEPRINRQGGRSGMKVSAVSYQTKMLDCKVDGIPEPNVSWTTSYGITLPTPYLGGRFQVHRNGSLELRGLRRSDAGQFVCLARNELGEAKLQVELEVGSTAERPSFPIPHSEAITFRSDRSEIILQCPARGKPTPDISWVLPNSTVLAPGTRLQRFLHYTGNGTLRIMRPLITDTGSYRCLAKNMAGQVEKVYVLEPGRKPQIRGATGVFRISYGQNLNLHCAAEGWPQPSISWTLPNGLVLDKPQVIGRVTYLINGTLQLRETATFDRGTYICKATNAFGSSALSVPVVVMVYPPRITSGPPSITRVNRGSTIKLNCIAVGIPKPDISWTLPGRTTLVSSNRFATQGGIHMTTEGSLVLQNPVLMNSGIYKCNAKNALGMDFKATYLQVL
ncbi:matrix-remodeling-associated protein 5 [Amia ocellicauda]|uniref:matrix-remodeling-associated protein 5 n=1 Tax=Amia ocellicauda TaxID=2972642 RepID=UPI0034642519